MILYKYFLIGVFLIIASCSPKDPELQNLEIQTSSVPPSLDVLELPKFPDYPAPKIKLDEDDSGYIYYPIKSPYDFSRVLNGYDQLQTHTGKSELFMPRGANIDNPVPAVIIMHGSGGIKNGRENGYAKLFSENGMAALIIDYYEPRGVTKDTPYVMKTMIATEVDIMSDAYSALKILSTHPAIDPLRIGITGYSYGGMGTRYVLDERLKKIMAPNTSRFALHMDIYGPCHQTLGHKITTGAPYLAVHGDNDNSVDPELCQEVYKEIIEGGSSVESHVIPGAGHAWENSEPLKVFPGSFVKDCTFSFDKNGTFLVNGKSGQFQSTSEMSRGQRAKVRAGLGELAGSCLGKGYIVGNNPEADNISKGIQIEFLERIFKIK